MVHMSYSLSYVRLSNQEKEEIVAVAYENMSLAPPSPPTHNDDNDDSDDDDDDYDIAEFILSL